MDQPPASRPSAAEPFQLAWLRDGAPPDAWGSLAAGLLSAETPVEVAVALADALAGPPLDGPRVVWLPNGEVAAPRPLPPPSPEGWRRLVRALAEARLAALALQTQLDSQAAELAATRARCRAIEAQAKTDALTGLANRRSFLEQADRLHAIARRYGTPFAVLILDVDHFKACNDVYGHAAGDVVLVSVARTLAESVRHADLAARYGGEEFVVLCPNTELQPALGLAERLRRALEETLLMPGNSGLAELPQGVTASFGVATVQPDDLGIDAVLLRADQALYQAKRNGRNRVETLE